MKNQWRTLRKEVKSATNQGKRLLHVSIITLSCIAPLMQANASCEYKGISQVVAPGNPWISVGYEGGVELFVPGTVFYPFSGVTTTLLFEKVDLDNVYYRARSSEMRQVISRQDLRAALEIYGGGNQPVTLKSRRFRCK